jgi:superfamily I DNA/RNA helicase
MSLALECATEAALARGDVTPRLLTGAEQDRIIANLLEGEALENGATVDWPESLSSDVRASRVFRNELRDVIDRCIDHGLTAADLSRLGAQHAMPEWQAVAAFWSGVLTDVLDSLRFGFGDAAELMRQATVAVATGAALDSCRLIVVDDAQELTQGTAALLRACASRGIPVIVAGNPDETATSFRGAVPQVLGRFGAIIGCPVETLYLSEVHRHGEKIRDVVNAIDARIGAAELGTQRRATVDQHVDEGQVIVIERSQRSSELSSVARVLRHAHVRDGVPWHRMAVIVRQGTLVESVARQLAIHEVATRTLVSDTALRDQPLVRDFLDALAMGRPDHELTIDEAERFLSSEITGMSSVDIRRLRLALRQHELLTGGQRTGPELVRDGLLNPPELDIIDAVPARLAARAARVLARVRDEQRAGATIEELLWNLWDGSVLPRELTSASEGTGLIAEEAHRKLDTVLALFASARRFVERESYRTAQDFIDDLLRTDVPEDTLAPSSSAEAVLVCTPPSVIGAEYDVVAVVAVQEGVWPNLRLRGQLLHAGRLNELIGLGADPVASNDARRELLNDELRKFSLPCSRARRTLVVSATNSADVVSSPFLALVRPPTAQLGTAQSDATHPEAAATSAVSVEGDDIDDYPLTLSAMTGRLRRELTHQFSGLPATSAPVDRDRAEELSGALARLALAGVPGAHPDDWYGLKGFSDSRNLNDEHDRAQGTYVHVSPSRLEAWQRNQLGWFIDTTVGGDQTVATGLGTLVHKVFEDVGNQVLTDLSAESLWSAVDARWHELSFEAAWLNERERTRTNPNKLK